MSARSILGDPRSFSEIEARSEIITGSATINVKQSLNPAMSEPMLRKLSRQQRSPPLSAARNNATAARVDLADTPKEYMSTLLSLQDKMTLARTKTLERSTALQKFLPIYEQTNLNKESSILANWQERQKEWDRIQADISRRLNTSKVIIIVTIRN